MEPEKQDTSDLLKLSFCKAMPKKFKKRFSPKCFIGLQKKNWIEIKPRIIYHKIQFASNRKKKNKNKKTSRCTFTTYTCYRFSLFEASIHTTSTMLFHPSMAGELFSGTGLKWYITDKTLLFSQAELITPSTAPTAISDHCMTCVYCNDKSLLCVSPPSLCTEAVMGTQ